MKIKDKRKSLFVQAVYFKTEGSEYLKSTLEYIECCGIQMKQVILSAPGLSDPGGVGQKWTNDGYQMRDEKSGNLRNVTKKIEKGKQVI